MGLICCCIRFGPSLAENTGGHLSPGGVARSAQQNCYMLQNV